MNLFQSVDLLSEAGEVAEVSNLHCHVKRLSIMKELGKFERSSGIAVFTSGLDQLNQLFIDGPLLRNDLF